MVRVRAVLGLIAGAILILSSIAHSILGWEALRTQLAATTALPDLILGLKIGWQFGGVCMLAFGIIMLDLFAKRLRGEGVSLLPAVVLAVTYLAVGIWALVVSDFNPFFFIFIVPGLLIAFAVSRPSAGKSQAGV